MTGQVKYLGRATCIESKGGRGREHVFGVELDGHLEAGILVQSTATSEPRDSVNY